MSAVLTTPGRTFDQGRKEQGFKSQEHLDAFYAYLDHTKSCPKCQQFGHVALDDGYQQVQIICPEGERLNSVSNQF